MIGVIDRFEKSFAIIELNDGNIINLEKSKLPIEAKEGDVIVLEEPIRIDYEETRKRKDKISKYLELWED